MTLYTKISSVLAKNPRLSSNTIALGGLLSAAAAVTTSRDKNESKDDDEHKLRFHKTKLTPLFPEPSNATKTTDCDFSTPPSRFNSIRRRRTTQQMEDEAHETKLEYVYDVNWAEPLGEGGFGAVYLGKEYKSGDFAAVKQITKEYTCDASFQREMDAFLHIRRSGGHPNICGLRENFNEGNYFYLVLDLIEGGEMFDHLIKDGAYSEADASRLVREVGSALSFLHGIGLVHTDLKPENLMLSSPNSSDAVIKVVDFGCAEIIDKSSPYYHPDGKEHNTITPGYSPPEMIRRRGNSHLEPSVDMFSMGVIIYIMLTGAHPFDITADSTDDQMNARIKWHIMPPLRNAAITAHLSPSAIDLIEKLLDWNPETRMTALEMLNHPWVKGETATKEKIADSEKRLKSFRRYKSGLEAEVFSSMVEFSDNPNLDDAARKTSLIERSFQQIDSENRGYITTSDLKKLKSKTQKKGGSGADEMEAEEESKLGLSGFSELLSKNMKNVYLPAGHVIFKEGDEGESMFFINSGRVEITTNAGFKATTEQGDFFGEGALLKKQGKRSATVKCVTPIHAIEIGRDYFEKYVDSALEIELAIAERDRLRRQERAKSILGIQNRMQREVIQKGDYVYKQEEEGDDIFLLDEGKVDIDVNGQSVFKVGAGELFGEYSTIFGRPRNTSARCLSDKCKIEVMVMDDFKKIVQSNPDVRDGLRDVVFRREFQKALVYATKKAFPSTEKELRATFDILDLDRSQAIDFDEVHSLLKNMDPSFSNSDIANIMKSLDLDSGGSIEWAEFRRIFGMHGKNSHPPHHESL